MNQSARLIQYEHIYPKLALRVEKLGLHPNPNRLAGMGAKEAVQRLKLAIAVLRRIPNKSGTECWNWPGGKSQFGYGNIRDSSITRYVHRISYCIFIETPPSELRVCHKCDNPPCFNPSHLFVGTDGDNVRDCRSKGRFDAMKVSGEKSGKAILTARQVIKGRKLRNKGLKLKAIAKQLGVPYWAMYGAISGKCWKHL